MCTECRTCPPPYNGPALQAIQLYGRYTCALLGLTTHSPPACSAGRAYLCPPSLIHAQHFLPKVCTLSGLSPLSVTAVPAACHRRWSRGVPPGQRNEDSGGGYIIACVCVVEKSPPLVVSFHPFGGPLESSLPYVSTVSPSKAGCAQYHAPSPCQAAVRGWMARKRYREIRRHRPPNDPR